MLGGDGRSVALIGVGTVMVIYETFVDKIWYVDGACVAGLGIGSFSSDLRKTAAVFSVWCCMLLAIFFIHDKTQ
jgi:hypothetical protein